MEDEPISDVPAESTFGDSEAPNPQPLLVQPSVAPGHPFWSKKGQGSKRKRKLPGASTFQDDSVGCVAGTALVIGDEECATPAFTGISVRELEFARNRTTDGAESSIASDFEGDVNKRSKRHGKGDGTNHSNSNPVDMMNAATFGSRKKTIVDAAPKSVSGEDSHDESCEEHEESDECASVSVNEAVDSTVRGERCIGCIFDREIVGMVDEFVRKHCGSMHETALYKAAAQHWINQIVRPRAAEGVAVPKWNWRSISNHYSLHVVDQVLQRTNSVRQLGMMEEFQSQSIIRVNPDGSKTLDSKQAELYLKLVALKDKQISALDASRMPPPTTRGGR